MAPKVAEVGFDDRFWGKITCFTLIERSSEAAKSIKYSDLSKANAEGSHQNALTVMYNRHHGTYCSLNNWSIVQFYSSGYKSVHGSFTSVMLCVGRWLSVKYCLFHRLIFSQGQHAPRHFIDGISLLTFCHKNLFIDGISLLTCYQKNLLTSYFYTELYYCESCTIKMSE